MKRWTSHGDSVGTGDRRLYRLYAKMIARCHNPNQKGYDRYGGSNILVCDGWRFNYKRFRNWAYSHGYKDGLSIDRIDTYRGYFPQNCRWVEVREQSRNRKDNVNFDGECAVDASIRLGGTKHLVSCRLDLGWSKEKAFTTPARPKIKR